MKKAILLLFAVAAMAGCSGLPHRVDVMYQPLATTKGGWGKVYLVSPRASSADTGEQVRWVVGQIQDNDGTVVDDIVSPVSPRDQVGDALKRELEGAGYQVLLGQLSPQEVTGPCLRISDVKVVLTEVPSWMKVTSSAKVSLKIELWRSGKLIKQEGYESIYQESYSRTEPEEIQAVLQKALEGMAGKAVPDIVRAIGPQTGEKL